MRAWEERTGRESVERLGMIKKSERIDKEKRARG
jgi:hypothetical protein